MQNISPTNNSDLIKITQFLNQGNNVFITGFAGTGKSYLLNELKRIYKDNLVLTSTTGISASNILGQTIHRWAGVGIMNIPINKFKETLNNTNFGYLGKAKSRIRKCQILAIDEISMLSAYHLEYLNEVFKTARGNNLPFGGIQVIFLGDFLQLPPVATNKEIELNPNTQLFAFESLVWNELNFKNILLKKIYRQNDLSFSKMLCNFRVGQITQEDLELVQQCFTTEEISLKDKLHIFPKRIQANAYNEQKLQELKSELFEYKTYDQVFIPDNVEDVFEYKKGIYSELNKECPAEYMLKLKVGCRVMLLVNMCLESSCYLVNGSCGTVLELGKSYVVVKFDNGVTKKISRWEFSYNEGEYTLAKRFQFPLKLAYATTIHKSQGMTFDEIVINCSSSFMPGQVYVGLSRVKTLAGLHITGFNPLKINANQKARYFYFDLEDSVMNDLKKELFLKSV